MDDIYETLFLFALSLVIYWLGRPIRTTYGPIFTRYLFGYLVGENFMLEERYFCDHPKISLAKLEEV